MQGQRGWGHSHWRPHMRSGWLMAVFRRFHCRPLGSTAGQTGGGREARRHDEQPQDCRSGDPPQPAGPPAATHQSAHSLTCPGELDDGGGWEEHVVPAEQRRKGVDSHTLFRGAWCCLRSTPAAAALGGLSRPAHLTDDPRHSRVHQAHSEVCVARKRAVHSALSQHLHSRGRAAGVGCSG